MSSQNSVDLGVPVRVIRGHESASSYSGKVYTYDGLYKVVQYWAEKGISGFTVFKYQLRRLEGQSILTTNQVQFIFGRVPKSSSEIRGLVCEDISGGQEDVPIPATNLVDDPPVAPTGKLYFLALQFFQVYESCMEYKATCYATGCNCEGACMDPKTCECARLNGFDFPYVHRDGGRLIEAKHVVFECGPNCGCGPSCVKRTSQRGLRYRLEVFRTPKKEWAVRTEELDSVSENNYVFEIDCMQTMRGLDGRERQQQDGSLPVIQNVDKIDDRGQRMYQISALMLVLFEILEDLSIIAVSLTFLSSVSLSSHHNLKLTRVMLLAADNIPPLQELTYDYGYALDSVYGPDGKVLPDVMDLFWRQFFVASVRNLISSVPSPRLYNKYTR
ncbi:Histone-lysine N-methyltransferase, H3 lysine-9 specific SUVH4 [Hibiscus syriacus]|uniref:Histone-lysine N-methyltransferase, H3 lysine-9 specific SUVH4 n=1 Tax=Hibiscus syriacus TaxID=106335 RepID=A0A6A3D784_HIBSY|nr:Histone-lysine N-methyltransferase, H3 lysine-9 specific SUVH4 [Hibiscus syriacus]